MNLKKELDPSEVFYQRDVLDLESWFKVTLIEYLTLIQQFDFRKLFLELSANSSNSLNLLDIGCGTAKFPSLLHGSVEPGIAINADLVDVSDYCLVEAAKVYNKLNGFRSRSLYNCSVENIGKIVPSTLKYDVIWAVHSLYNLNLGQLHKLLPELQELLAPRGKFLIYQLAQNSCYTEIYQHYLSHFPDAHSQTNYLTAEMIEGALDFLKIKHAVKVINLNHRVACDDERVLENYLKKCVLDNRINVFELFDCKLKKFAVAKEYVFPQEVHLITIDN